MNKHVTAIKQQVTRAAPSAPPPLRPMPSSSWAPACAERLLDQPLGASQRILLGTLAYYLLWTGQTARLDRVLLKVDRMCAGVDAAPATLLRWYSASVMIRSLRGQVDEALAHARQALAVTLDGPAPMRGRAHLLLVLAALAARNAAPAIRRSTNSSAAC